MVSDLITYRDEFRKLFYSAQSALASRLLKVTISPRWLKFGTQPFAISHFLSAGRVGVFVRGDRGSKVDTIQSILEPHAAKLAAEFGGELRVGSDQELFNTSIHIDTANRSEWPKAFDWLAAQSARYEAALLNISRI